MFVPFPVTTIVDLGAGTGALTRLLLDKAEEVIAVEPDDRMRAVLAAEVGGAHAVAGTGEAIPVPDGSADAVTASSSWHWMDPIATLQEAARVLVPGGTLGVLWSGPDPEGPFLVQARAMFASGGRSGDRSQPGESSYEGDSRYAGQIIADADRPAPTLEIHSGAPFDQPEHETFRWNVALNADELIGLLGTFSWIITMPDETRERAIGEARRLLQDALGVVGDVTVDVAFRCDAWRSLRNQ